MRTTLLGLLALGFLSATATAGNIMVINSGFETPDLGSGGNAYGYVGTQTGGNGPISPSTPGIGWTFSSTNAGIAANSSNFGVVGAPNGNADGGTSTVGQAGVVQVGDGTFNSANSTFIQQVLHGFQTGTATISFLAFGRSTLGPNTIDVYLDNSLLGSATPPVGIFTAYSFVTNVSPGSHTLRFVGNNHLGFDKSSFIDNVDVVNTVPEPATIALFGSALLMCAGRRVLQARSKLFAARTRA